MTVLKTELESDNCEESETKWVERYSDWNKLKSAAVQLLRFIRRGRLQIMTSDLEDEKLVAERVLIRRAQHEVDHIINSQPLPKWSRLSGLDPFLDYNGLHRVRGRIIHSDLPLKEKRPIIIPRRHYLATLIIRHCHEQVKHQGRNFTEGAVRAAGFWITKRLISTYIHKCVTCRKLRATTESQIMADLPGDRLEVAPPFSNVGVDVFSPWTVVTRRTRGGQANSKRWAVLFTCLVTRAVHIELVEELSSSAFINTLRRFTTICGEVNIFRSDRGTNFVGAVNDLRIEAIKVQQGPVHHFLKQSNAVWMFNPPHSSHMGGVCQRMIGVARKILDSMISNNNDKNLTHDVLNTFMAEMCENINSRPLLPVSNEPEAPLILTPTMLLTQKVDYSQKDMYLAEWRRVQALAKMNICPCSSLDRNKLHPDET